MGSGALFSIRFGQRDEDELHESVRASFVLIAGATVLLNALAVAALDFMRVFLRVSEEVWSLMRAYLRVIFCGVAATFLYNYFASFLRSVGELHRAANFPGAVRADEHRAGSLVRAGDEAGCDQCGGGDGDRAVCLRPGHRGLCVAALSANQLPAQPAGTTEEHA